MINLKIDPEFQSQIPPLTDDEFKQLEENILKEGKLLSPLIVWNNTLVDGHNRYTLDFVPKSCAKGAAPLWNPCSHRLWAMWIRRTESSHKGAPGCLRRGKGTSAEV